ncbi:MAG: TetR family transcriptional regulator [Ectothiorhodospiraceae bacterium]|jgi:AcrR family transcriptional regulator|nr:TetR family transcriptional regulator [Ectothiorhodospiraceae bacterium]
MSETATPICDPSRAATRRAQIRAAAKECFCRHGFHGTSIAQISKTAGMSTGHIYHYFENKEAIIADIVAQDLERLLTLNVELRSAQDVHSAMLERAVEGIESKLDPDAASLQLEITAEAARNPRVADIVQNADRHCRESLGETIRNLRRATGHADSETDIAGMVEVLAAMFEGLMIRSIRNPGLDRDAVVRMFREVIGDLLSRPANRG